MAQGARTCAPAWRLDVWCQPAAAQALGGQPTAARNRSREESCQFEASMSHENNSNAMPPISTEISRRAQILKVRPTDLNC